jgi:Uma2 family endonuclease
MAKARDELGGGMTVERFLVWLEDQPECPRYELIEGVPVAMAPERAAHGRLKAEIWLALRDGIRSGGLPCEVFPDGMGVKIDETSLYEPDAVVHCAERLSGEEVLVPAPIIVVEVLSPSTHHVDTGLKLQGYFRLASVRHYLIARADRPAIIHHRRTDDGAIETRIVTAGTLLLDPPGLTLDIDQIYRDAAFSELPG